MQMLKTGVILALLLSIQMLNGCAGGVNESDNNKPASNISVSNASESNKNTAIDNAGELSLLVKLPFEPEEVAWKETAVPQSQNEKKLSAVIRFSPEDTKKLISQIENQKTAEPVTIKPELWYPAELLNLGELNGDDTLKGLAYSAQDFMLPPYTGGRIARIENTEYFVLELFAK